MRWFLSPNRADLAEAATTFTAQERCVQLLHDLTPALTSRLQPTLTIQSTLTSSSTLTGDVPGNTPVLDDAHHTRVISTMLLQLPETDRM